MKHLSMLALAVSLTSTAFAYNAPSVCNKRAAAAVAKISPKNYYDSNGIEAFECGLASNRSMVVCEVGASKGDGAAMDTYRVALNRECSRVVAVELIGEE